MKYIRLWIIRCIALYVRNTPIEKGRWTLLKNNRQSLKSLFPINIHKIIRSRYGFHVNLDLDDYVTQEIFLSGEYEKEVSDVVLSVLKEGDIFVDVGANIGYFSLLASSIVGDNGKVYSFEPLYYNNLRDNLKINGTDNVKVYPLALSDQPGEARIFKSASDNRGMSSFREITNSVETIVKTDTLDNIIGHDTCPDLIKIDVEGAEYKALIGMSGIIDRCAPKLIIEISRDFLIDLDSSAEELCNFLFSRGYRMFQIGGDTMEEITSLEQVLNHQFNAYFIPPGDPTEK